jgi:mono/diheme cytochrome c family protein
MKYFLSLFLITCSFLALNVVADEPPKMPESSTQQGVTYEKDIRPIFEKNCVGCHGEKKQKSDLRLDSLEASIKGGKNGPNILPGKSAQSSLVIAVARLDKDTAMPPKKSLKTEEVALIRAWIDQGAK